MSEPEGPIPSAPEGTTTQRHRGGRYALGTAVAITLLGATAAAIITPERVDAIFSWLGGATPSPVTLKTVTTRDGAIAVDIPEDWSMGQSSWNTTDHAGTGLVAGTQLTTEFPHDGAYVGASAEVTRAANVTAMSLPEREAWVDEFVDLDWTLDGCVPVAAEPKSKSGWMVATREWKECAATRGHRMLEFAALSDEADVLLIGQVSLTERTPDAVFDSVLDSVVVATGKLGGRASSGDLVAPNWMLE